MCRIDIYFFPHDIPVDVDCLNPPSVNSVQHSCYGGTGLKGAAANSGNEFDPTVDGTDIKQFSRRSNLGRRHDTGYGRRRIDQC